MAVLGKRKAPAQAPAAAPSTSAEDAEEIFRRHFEARFKPLDDDAPATKKVDRGQKEYKSDEDDDDEDDDDLDDDEDDDDDDDDEDDDDENDEWGGLSNEDATEQQQQVVEVVDHSSSQKAKPSTMSKRELKAFMSSRPPNASSLTANPSTTSRDSSKSANALPEDAPSLLAQDLELRRLLSESHLLSALNKTSSSSSPNGGGNGELKAFATGRTRQKATDMRIQALGSKVSILKQDKMPMNIRKGVNALASARETKRRREAKENGVILEREAPKKSKGGGKRKEFGLDRPGVGRMSGASLKLSDRDIKSIEGTRDTFGRRGRR